MGRSEIRLNSLAGLLLVAAIVALAIVVPRLQNRVDTALVRDDPACPHSSNFPATAAGATRLEILCLLNKQRADHGLPALREEAHLDAASQVQSDDIVRRRFWAHVNPDGKTPADRIYAAGYPQSTATGENLAWGEESEATPVKIVDGWMHSPGHRANILEPRYREVGIGVTLGAPRSTRLRAAVYATDFGGGPATPQVKVQSG